MIKKIRASTYAGKSLMFFVLLAFTLMASSVEAADLIATDVSDLKTKLELPSSDTVRVADNITSLNLGATKIKITANKVLDLNNATLNATSTSSYSTSGGIELANSSSLTSFTIKNGTLVGGSSVGLGRNESKAGFIFADTNAANLKVTVQDITHNNESSKGDESLGSFFKGRLTDIEFKGKIRLYNSGFNIRALNVKMYGNPNDLNDPENTDFYGYVKKNASNEQYSEGNGGNNIAFAGHDVESAKSIGKTTKNVDILKNAYVVLDNDTYYNSGDLEFANNINNFAQINLDGTLIASAKGVPIRTTSAYDKGVVGTPSDQSEFNINPESVVKLSTSQSQNNKGVIYSYSLDINVNNPKIFDFVKINSSTQFFHSWTTNSASNLRFSNTDIAVWPKASEGKGMPSYAWPNVSQLNAISYNYLQSQTAYKKIMTITPTNSEILNNFYPENFSRISNDINFPEVIPNSGTIGNNESVLSGTTNYTAPGGSYINQVAVNATVTMKVGSITKTTTTDSNGNWSFTGLDLTGIPGGSTIALTVVDTDKLIQKNIANVTVVDKIAPKATGKVIKTTLSKYDFTLDPTLGLASYSDETTSATNLVKSYVDSLEVLKQKADSLGVKDIKINVTDQGNNNTLVNSQLLVTDNENANGLIVIGNDFTTDYDAWIAMTTDQRRKEIITKGEVRAWAVTDNLAVEVTNDASKFNVSYTAATWKPKDVITVSLNVGNYTKTIKVTLTNKEVTADINYLDTEDSVIKTKKSQIMVSGDSYTIKPEVIPGYQVKSATVDGKAVTLNTDKSIQVTPAASNLNIKFVYESIHYKLSLSVDNTAVMIGDSLNYTFTVKSGMVYPDGQTPDDYKDLAITLPVGVGLVDIRDIKVENNTGQTIGTGQYDEASRKISANLTTAVKNTEDIKVYYTGTVDSSLIVGSTIIGSGIMLANYQVNGTERPIAKMGNSVYSTVSGGLTLMSKPETIDFGEISYLAKGFTVENPKIDESLVVSDTRDDVSNGWTLSAKLVQPLTNGVEELAGDVVYRLNKKDLVLSDASQNIFVNPGNGETSVNITDTWGTIPESDGLKLKFKTEDKIKNGNYAGKIRWVLMAGQP